MKPVVLFSLAFVSAALAPAQWSVGQKVPAFTYYELAGETKTWPGSDAGHTTVVMFISAKCPISNTYADRMGALYREYAGKGVRFLFLNANSNEDAAEVSRHIKDVSFPFSVFKDVGNKVADAAAAQMTPESFVIDGAGVLRYHGAIDDSSNEARIKRRGVRDALDAIRTGGDITVTEIKSFGCTIKRLRKKS